MLVSYADLYVPYTVSKTDLQTEETGRQFIPL
jgi:hypothetical protein